MDIMGFNQIDSLAIGQSVGKLGRATNDGVDGYRSIRVVHV